MRNELMIFEGDQVEILELNGEVLFNPYHVGECLELAESSVRNYLAKMNNKQAVLLKNSDVRDKDIRKLNNAGENFLTESGVYKLVFKSRKPSAEKFTDWIADEVLPALRQTGTYTINTTHQYPVSAASMESATNAGRLLERLMKLQGASPFEIALVVKSIYQQAGIEILDCFVKIPAYEQLSFNEIITR